MGWSCAKAAAETMDSWVDACVKQTGSQNVFAANGKRYFWEVSNREYRDGAITGTVFAFVGESEARQVGSFRIDGDGKVVRAPKGLLALIKEAA